MTNIQKVAKLAKVSVATVSRVLNNADNVAPKTRCKVKEAIEQANYVPNMLARNFRTSKSQSILVILTNISNLFYLEIVHGISEYAGEQGYDILLSETDGTLSKQIESLKKVKNRIADGAILLESTVHDDTLLMLEKNNPVVLCCTYNDEINLPFVTVDNERGGYIATKALLEAGRRNLAFVGTSDKSMYNHERRRGFLKALNEFGVTTSHILENAPLTFEGGRKVTTQIIANKKNIDGIFFVSDMLAIGAMSSLKENGLRIPEDISVIGYDNIELCDIVNPSLTSINQPAHKMGRETSRLLIEQIRDKNTQSARKIIFQPELIQRKSL
jgi:DNA-binding LacI/PurR family transcriptional regulator